MVHFLRKKFVVLAILASFFLPAEANPTGPQVTAGSASVSGSGNQTTVTQSSDRAIINWDSFSIGAGETVRFLQPNELSAILNRVVGADPSLILGALKANGQVFLVNPNGVFFGPGSSVDVSSLVVSTLQMSDQDFMTGNLQFGQHSNKELAAIINQGTLRVQDNGLLVLVAPHVSNEGLIIASQGKVALGAGEQAAVSFDAGGLVHFEVADLANDKSTVVMPQNVVSEVLAGVVSDPGIAVGTELAMVDGQLQLVNGSGTLIQSGTVLAEGGSAVLDSTAATALSPSASLSGSRVLLLSQGQAAALPGSQVDVGENGFAELSASTIVAGLTVEGTGQYLIDPPVLTVADGPLPAMPAADTVYEEALEASAIGVTLLADDSIVIEDIGDDAITLMSGNTLELETTNAAGAGVVFNDEDDAFQTFGTGSILVDTSNIVGGKFESESVVAFLTTGTIGSDSLPIEVTSPLLSLSSGGDVFLDTETSKLFASVTGNLGLREVDDLELDSVSVTGNAIITTDFSLSGAMGSDPDLTTGGDASLVSFFGTVGTPGNPLDVSIGGDLLTSAGDIDGSSSVYLTGSVTGAARVSAITPGLATINGMPLEIVFDPGLNSELLEELVDLGSEFGLGEQDIEDLFEELGLLADMAEGRGPGKGTGPKGGPGKGGRGGPGGAPRIAQAGLGGRQLSTQALLNLNVAQFQQLKVIVEQPSPFDAALSEPNLTADQLLDVSPLDLNTFDLSFSYDINNDPVITNPNIRAGDLFELGAGDLADVPIGLH